MNRIAAASAAALLIPLLPPPATAAAASDTDTTSIPVNATTSIQMQVSAHCDAAQTRCFFNTTANLMTPGGPTGFPGDTWARQTITIRSSDKNVWQEAWYSAPSGNPRELKGANHDNVLSKMYQALNDVEISITYFGGGPIERFKADGDSVPTDWTTGQPTAGADFIACSQIQVVYGGVNLTTPTACAQTRFG